MDQNSRITKNESLNELFKTVAKKCEKAGKAYKQDMDLYSKSRTPAQPSQPKSIGETQKLQVKIDKIQNISKAIKKNLSRANSTSTRTSVGLSPTMCTSWANKKSLDLHWDEEGEPHGMPKEENPMVSSSWKFQREFFKE